MSRITTVNILAGKITNNEAPFYLTFSSPEVNRGLPDSAPFYTKLTVRRIESDIITGPVSDDTVEFNRRDIQQDLPDFPMDQNATLGVDTVSISSLKPADENDSYFLQAGSSANTSKGRFDPKKQRLQITGSHTLEIITIKPPSWFAPASLDAKKYNTLWGWDEFEDGSFMITTDAEPWSDLLWRDYRGSYTASKTAGTTTIQYDWTLE